MSSLGRWFITGTDTDVGKTYVTSALAAGARDRGTVVAAKPIASGCLPSDASRDAALLSQCAGHPPREWATAPEALSPHRATLSPAFDAHALQRWLDELSGDTVLIEGVGGWLVPLQTTAPQASIPDLARWSRGQILLVAANRIGVLNHTLLTAQSIASYGMALVGVILNNGADAAIDDASRSSNLNDLRALLDVPVVPCPSLDLSSPNDVQSVGESLWQQLLCYRSS